MATAQNIIKTNIKECCRSKRATGKTGDARREGEPKDQAVLEAAAAQQQQLSPDRPTETPAGRKTLFKVRLRQVWLAFDKSLGKEIFWSSFKSKI